MAKHVEVTVSCDNCGGKDQDVSEFSVFNSKRKQVVLDLHPKCHAEIYGPGLELADKAGQLSDKQPAPAAKKAEGARICLLCPETRDTDWSIRDHFREAHGLTGAFPEAYGSECPVDGRTYPKIGHHVRQAHPELDLPHYSHAFIWAKENGDPHGTLAKQIAALQKLVKA